MVPVKVVQDLVVTVELELTVFCQVETQLMVYLLVLKHLNLRVLH